LLSISVYTQVTACDPLFDRSWTQCSYSSRLHQHGSRQIAWYELLGISNVTRVTVWDSRDYDYHWLFNAIHQHILSFDFHRKLGSLFMIVSSKLTSVDG
jgi:hypothetical protein